MNIIGTPITTVGAVVSVCLLPEKVVFGMYRKNEGSAQELSVSEK